jgi:hypothetical protein
LLRVGVSRLATLSSWMPNYALERSVRALSERASRGPLNADVMQRRRTSLWAFFAGVPIAAAAASDTPTCESEIRPIEIKDLGVIIERCVFSGEARATFTIGTDGATSEIVVEVVSNDLDARQTKCLTEYTTYMVQDLRFPTRSTACRHSIPVRMRTD